MSTDILDETIVSPLTQADYDRMFKLDSGIKKLAVELEELKARAKAEHTKQGTFVHGKVIVKIGEQKRKDVDETQKSFPFEKFPQFYKTDPVFDINAKGLEDFVVIKPVPTISISFASE